MKNASIIISSLALIGVLVLFGLRFSNDKSGSKGQTTVDANGNKVANTSNIAYVDIDTLEEHYTYLKNKKEEFKKRQAGMKEELQRSAQQLQNDIANVQRKAQAGTLTQAEYEAAEKRVGQMQQSLATREQALTEQLLKEQDEFNNNLKDKLDLFLAEYNKSKGYDFILSYTKSGSILYANDALDITRDVIDGMNSKGESMSDTTKKKNK